MGDFPRKYIHSPPTPAARDTVLPDTSVAILRRSVNLADNYNWFEVTWTSTAVTISVNGKVVRRVSGSGNVPQQPLYVRIHSRSIGYSEMAAGSTFSSYVEEFHFEPLNE
jgi:beta-glucanase (GH16 family)